VEVLPSIIWHPSRLDKQKEHLFYVVFNQEEKKNCSHLQMYAKNGQILICLILELKRFVLIPLVLDLKSILIYSKKKFANNLDKVCERIGASTENIIHNGPNSKLIDGCK
jgi:hypothetical protein